MTASFLAAVLTCLLWQTKRLSYVQGLLGVLPKAKIVVPCARQPLRASLIEELSLNPLPSTINDNYDKYDTTTNNKTIEIVLPFASRETAAINDKCDKYDTTTNNKTIEIVLPFASTETAATLVSPSPSVSSSSSSRSSVATLDVWKRRLITHEDPFSFHKFASVGYTLSTAILLATAANQALNGDFATIPPSLEPVMHVFTVSNIVMCGAGIRMSFLHRQGNIASRNAFLGTAVSSLFSGYFLVWISPFAMGDIFDNIWINRACFAALVGLNTVFIADTVIKTEELVDGRRDKKVHDYRGRVLMDTLGYIFPVAFGMPLVAATGLIASVWHDRPWFLDQVLFIDQMTGTPGMQSHIFYQQLVTSMGASYASLFVTLRDKRLINKMQELTGITIFALPAFIWSMYTTVVFLSYLFVEHQ